MTEDFCFCPMTAGICSSRSLQNWVEEETSIENAWMKIRLKYKCSLFHKVRTKYDNENPRIKERSYLFVKIVLLLRWWAPNMMPLLCSSFKRYCPLRSNTLFGLGLGLDLVLVPLRSDLVKVVLTTSLLGNRPGTYTLGNSATGCQRCRAMCGRIAEID